MSNTTPKLFSHYEIVREIGRGGMGVVYEAVDPRLERTVAIKVIEVPNDPSVTERAREELIERFKREARASARLNHPNIVSIFDFGEQDGSYYMVMEMLHGRNLAQLLQISSPMSLEIALKSLIQVCSALSFAHQQGIIHRDIKPANIVILDNGVTKLADFGIARLEASQSNLTQAGSILGSLLYISPEQLMNAKTVDKRADIYSLGVTAYEILTGQIPYSGTNVGEIVMKIMQETPPLPSHMNANLPSELDAILFKCMGKSADSRYASTDELAADLNNVLMRLALGGAASSPPPAGAPMSLDSTVSRTMASVLPLPSMGTAFGTEHVRTASGRGDEFTLVEGIDDTSLYSAVHRVVQKWNVENLTTNTLLEAIYKDAEKSQALVINNSVILLIFKGLLVGVVMKQPELLGSRAYTQMASWQKFEMKQCSPLAQDEAWLVLLGAMLGASRLANKHPVCTRDDVRSILEAQKRANFTGVLRITEKKTHKWVGMLDGSQQFSITMPYPEGKPDSEFLEMEIYTPRMTLLGPSLRKVLVEAQLQLVSKSVNRPTLSLFLKQKDKGIKADTLEEALRNSELSVLLGQDPVYTIGERKVKYSDFLKETVHYRVMDWLLFENMYNLSRTGQLEYMKRRLSWLWAIKSLKFIQPVKVPGFSSTFDIIAYNSSDQLCMLGRVEPTVTPEQLQRFIEDVKSIKAQKDEEDIRAAVLISYSAYAEGVLQQFYALTTKPMDTSMLNFSNAAKGFVRLGWNKGFFVFLVTQQGDGFAIAAPAE